MTEFSLKASLVNGLTVLLIIAVGCSRAGGDDKATDGVLVNGVRWATRNVGDTPGTFADTPATLGGRYTWSEAQTACPEGWRLPRNPDYLRLRDWARWSPGIGLYGGMTVATKPQLTFMFAELRNSVEPYTEYWAGTISSPDYPESWYMTLQPYPGANGGNGTYIYVLPGRAAAEERLFVRCVCMD